MKRIYLPIFSGSVKGKSFSLEKGNPGIGGTQFTAIILALSIAKNKSDWIVVLVNSTEIHLEESSPNIKQVICKSSVEFFSSLQRDRLGIIIASAAILNKTSLSLVEKLQDNLICWCHHPFDPIVKNMTRKLNLKAVVCVGVYQYYSNKSTDSNFCHIQNIFQSPKLPRSEEFHVLNKQKINIVYLGALIPTKGFLDIAKSWKQLKERFPGIILHVIGSAATYGLKPDLKLVPASADFAQDILKFIPEEDIRNGTVIFYGNLGEEKFDVIEKCDLAILNPTGASEAFPASPLECMACGVPVIASDDYGMSDCMRFFPELIVDGHQDIANKVEWLIADPLRYRELQQRAIVVAKWFDSQKELIVTRWIRLLESVFDPTSQDLTLKPTMPFYGSRLKMFYRQYIWPKVELIQQYAQMLSLQKVNTLNKNSVND